VLQRRDEGYARLLDAGDNPYHNNCEYKATSWNQTVDDISELGLEGSVEEVSIGLLLVSDKYYYSPTSRKWRVKGKSVWYRSRGFKDFYRRFVSAS
jgi:hypothetical protein